MTVAFQDYYEILGVPRTAAQAEIQKAYRRLARKYHPDVNKDKGAEDQFKKVNEAYEVLKNPDSRRKYDQLGSQWKSGDPFSPKGGQAGGFDFSEAFSGSGFSSFFDMFFGSQGKSQQADFEAVEQEATIEVTLEDAYHGVEKEIIVKPMHQGAEKRIQVRIPPGAHEGSKIRLRGQGRSRVRGGKAGDLLLRVKLKAHPLFRPEGRDLISTLKLSPWEAALGAKVSVPTLEKPVTLSVPSGTQGGQRLRLKGKGLPKPGGIQGDIYYEVEIAIPKILNEVERRHFEALAQLSVFHPRQA